ncbi:MAG: MFS transporter [Clostridia bacterium]|nr:MFS transporter [Clostridia bacterium]
MNKFKRLKLACYSSNVSMATVSTLSPLLLLTFRETYGISYSLLGLLVLINFCTQLIVDTAFSVFSHKFNIPLAVKLIPVISLVGFVVYALSPVFFEGQTVFIGLAIGTVIFSAASGLAEVLISPIIAAIPSDDPDREMSKLHSVFAWGVVGIVLFSTAFLAIFGQNSWQWLVLALCSISVAGIILYSGVKIPDLQSDDRSGSSSSVLKNGTLWLCVLSIFLGGSAECVMSQWCSTYLEGALGISKVIGDIFGVAMFSLALGLGRSLYSAFGKNIMRVLIFGAIGATVCYITAAISNAALVGLIACALTGFFTSMLWPGNLIVVTDIHKGGGVMIFALMAAGGDLGASIGPQLVGVITDAVIGSDFGISLAADLSLSPEQLGLKVGLLVAALFPLILVFVLLLILRHHKRCRLCVSEN